MQKHTSKLSSKLNKLAVNKKYLVAAVLLVIPLFPKFPLFRVPGTYVSIRLEDLLILLVAFVVMCEFIRNPIYIKSKVVKTIVIFFSVAFISTLSGIFVLDTVVAHLGFLHYVRRFEYIIPLFLGLFATKSKEDLGFYIKVIMISIFVSFLYGLGQKYWSFPFIVTQNEEYAKGIALTFISGGHISSTFAGHYDMASYMVLLVPVIVVIMMSYKNIKNNLLSWVCLFLIYVSGVWLIAVSGSRVSAVSYLIASSFALLLARKYKAIFIVGFLSLVVFSQSPSLLARYKNLYEVTKGKVLGVANEISSTMENELYVHAQNETESVRIRDYQPQPTPAPVFEDRSTSIRINVEWPRAIRALTKNPLLGTGYSSITLATDNDYLRLLGEIGALGFVAFLSLIIKIVFYIKELVLSYKKLDSLESSFSFGLAGGILGILTNALFIDIFEASKFAITFWLVMGIMISVSRRYNK